MSRATARAAPAGDGGPIRFARYASPPNRLGYCGPGAAAEFAELIQANAVDELRHSAQEFAAAFPYLELLAGANRGHGTCTDPLADVVVEAYWIGNRLLDRVTPADFGRSIDDRFRRRAGRNWNHVELSVPSGVANHAYHVLVASPWVGLMRDGIVDEPLAIVDACRISWGTVVGREHGDLLVRRTPMVWNNGRLDWGPTSVERVAAAIAADVGDVVSVHWGQACEVLTATQQSWLRRVTQRQMDVAEQCGRPG